MFIINRPETRHQVTTDSEPRDTGVSLVKPLFEKDQLISPQPEKFQTIIDACDNDNLPSCKILKNVLMNSGSASTIVEECELEYDALKNEPIMISRSKEPPQFTRFPYQYFDSMVTEENNAIQEDSKEKEAAMVIFLHLFKL